MTGRSVLPQSALPPETRGPIPGRTCGTCTLCCKAVAVEELAKPIGDWCPHCVRQGASAFRTLSRAEIVNSGEAPTEFAAREAADEIVKRIEAKPPEAP